MSCEPKKLSALPERPQCHSEEEFGEFLLCHRRKKEREQEAL